MHFKYFKSTMLVACVLHTGGFLRIHSIYFIFCNIVILVRAAGQCWYTPGSRLQHTSCYFWEQEGSRDWGAHCGHMAVSRFFKTAPVPDMHKSQRKLLESAPVSQSCTYQSLFFFLLCWHHVSVLFSSVNLTVFFLSTVLLKPAPWKSHPSLWRSRLAPQRHHLAKHKPETHLGQRVQIEARKGLSSSSFHWNTKTVI